MCTENSSRLPDLGDRRHDCEQEEADAEREEPDAPAGDRLASARERSRAHGVGARDDDDRHQLQRLERPARQQGGLIHLP